MGRLSIKNAQKAYGTVKVLHGIDLDINDGEFVVLVGPSGCGKSTLLRMIAGLESISGGAIEIADREVNNVAPKNRDIAMVFQNYALYPHMTVARNMGFSLKMRGLSRKEIDARIKTAAGILGLDQLLDRYPKQLSGGQRQRVAMGRAIVRDPAVFLFDEPLSNLDAKMRISMRGEIKELHERLRTTIVYVTHDQIEAMTMADRIVIMKDGAIQQVGTPDDIYSDPANLFVADFIGSPAMNLMQGRIEDGAFKSGSSLVLQVQQPRSDVGQIVLGVRPEQIQLGQEGVAATVKRVEPTGSETVVTLDAGGVTVTALSRSEKHYQVGDAETFGVSPAAYRFFDASSGQKV
ncbi:ABC transporter ATP-binding protein [Hoeflea prorocentri]|uniref:Sn-glycerol-3-phosphate ABC transporter ATP-binding protein UgpC n=1 Tax=Hoeflea prorocentri TaxID=1922333 RepID=A0A9X3ZFY3_9HYPH|nr:sn-glycerol-3-phosphate ABC transporter ATP-binding protein UgpC [Hoeflea prorocentri]MCY6379619.1 sn-glycerol-3-phosphate ABC transporter ATP-binding protein UgpC [Hoeflea prorocentri]MDA5397419.1 sn-glycerol-3-phosphate ABC transporter ATP-binding protein UgpC [Hoeflea prorocentri]